MSNTNINARILEALQELADSLAAEASVRSFGLSPDLLTKLQRAFDVCAEFRRPHVNQNSFIFEASQTSLAFLSGYVEEIVVSLSGSDWSAIGEDGRVLLLEDLQAMDRADLIKAIERFRRETGDL